jgi:hypothetical protein
VAHDLRGADPLVQALQGLPAPLRTTLGGARSPLVVPLTLKEHTIGVVRLHHWEARACQDRVFSC